LKISHLLPALTLAFLASSCSWLDRMERSLVGEEEKAPSAKRATVSKAQYDELLVKVEELKRENEQLKSGRPSSDALVGDLSKAPVVEPGAQGQTVDVFAGGAPAGADVAAAPSGLEGQLMNYRQALSLQEQNAGEAMRLYASLARGAAPAIRARSQLRMGEILMKQGEWDLAMQAFDEIVTRQAHSGAVIDALKHLVVCADKLGLAQKRDQYQSLLRDVFQVGT
jgi:hypothetical protein